jgi:hypothetical protein
VRAVARSRRRSATMVWCLLHLNCATCGRSWLLPLHGRIFRWSTRASALGFYHLRPCWPRAGRMESADSLGRLKFARSCFGVFSYGGDDVSDHTFVVCPGSTSIRRRANSRWRRTRARAVLGLRQAATEWWSIGCLWLGVRRYDPLLGWVGAACWSKP